MFIFNDSKLSGNTRTEKLGGREYLVAPVSMLVPGVLHGSQGPIFYPESEVTRNADSWNFMPLTLNHPDEEGKPVSARRPEIIEKFMLGFVFNVDTSKGKLDAEAWFDVERTRVMAPEILENIEKNLKTELSTGLYLDTRPVKNKEYNGKKFSAIARNFRPDHLAILPNTKGACSVEDGCGVLNEQGTDSTVISPSEDIVTNRIKEENDKFVLYSKDGKRLGDFDTKEAATKRLGQIEHFKKKANNESGLSKDAHVKMQGKKKCNCKDKKNCKCEEKMAKGRKDSDHDEHDDSEKHANNVCPFTNKEGCGAGSKGGKGFAKGNSCGAKETAKKFGGSEGNKGTKKSLDEDLDKSKSLFEKMKTGKKSNKPVKGKGKEVKEIAKKIEKKVNPSGSASVKSGLDEAMEKFEKSRKKRKTAA